VVGSGGVFSAQLLQEMNFVTSDNRVVKAVMQGLLAHYLGLKKEKLTKLGLERLPRSKLVVVAVNNRPLSASDTEHGCCMQYVIMERGPVEPKG
jgi:hypothetical protein